LVLTVGSVLATLGLITNSAAVVIGAMVIAPLMLPIRGLAFGALTGNIFLFRRGLLTILVGTLLVGWLMVWRLLVGISLSTLKCCPVLNPPCWIWGLQWQQA